MSSGNTEETRRERADDDAVIHAAALIRNDVLRRALAIAACEFADLASAGSGNAVASDDGIALMVCWVMRACEELGLKEGAAGL